MADFAGKEDVRKRGRWGRALEYARKGILVYEKLG